jgi:hypothetical protein
MKVEVYFATPEIDPPLPSQAYKDQILQGAKAWKLPEEYIRLVLETIQVAGD